MQTEKIEPAAIVGASVIMRPDVEESVQMRGRYEVVCFDKDGVEKWRDTIENLVVNVGKADLLDKYFAGSAYTAAFYMGLVDNASFSAYAAGDTMSSHSGWLESTAYSNSTRVAVSWNSASGGSKASTSTTFNINATATIRGVFLATNSTKGGTTGTLYSGGDFTGGNRTVNNGDSLVVTYTATA